MLSPAHSSHSGCVVYVRRSRSDGRPDRRHRLQALMASFVHWLRPAVVDRYQYGAKVPIRFVLVALEAALVVLAPHNQLLSSGAKFGWRARKHTEDRHLYRRLVATPHPYRVR